MQLVFDNKISIGKRVPILNFESILTGLEVELNAFLPVIGVLGSDQALLRLYMIETGYKKSTHGEHTWSKYSNFFLQIFPRHVCLTNFWSMSNWFPIGTR